VTVYGLDVSSAQGDLTDAHWAAIAATKSFVYAEARTGNDGNDTHFSRYVASAKAAGLVTGAYLFAYCLPEDSSHPGRGPEDQAQAFFEASGGLGGTSGELPPAIDLEWPASGDWPKWGCSAAQISDWALRCAVRVETLFGRRPAIYTYPYFARAVVLAGLNAYPLWIASYRAAPDVPLPWSSEALWQTSGGGLVLPNGSKCDEDQATDEAYSALIAQ
jgi:GH25 family lysozyme M1 (1,4-beta-N-acetylmuramidase)